MKTVFFEGQHNITRNGMGKPGIDYGAITGAYSVYRKASACVVEETLCYRYRRPLLRILEGGFLKPSEVEHAE